MLRRCWRKSHELVRLLARGGVVVVVHGFSECAQYSACGVYLSRERLKSLLLGYILLARVEPAANTSSPFVVQDVG